MITFVSVSVVVPVYRSSGTLAQLIQRIHQSVDSDHEIILVDDGSGDGTWETLATIANGDPRVRAIKLGRNVGQHGALLAGIREARFPVTVTIDDDLQNPPEEIPRLVSALESSEMDVVYGTPSTAAQVGWRRGSGLLARLLIKSTLGVPEISNMSSFRAFRTDLRDAFSQPLGPGVSIDALLAWGTPRFTAIEVQHDERTHGTSNYSVRSLVRFAVDTTTGYSTGPLRAASLIGFTTAAFGLLLMVVFALIPFFRGISVQGFPFLASAIILFAGIQLVTIGVIGEYLARMHFRVMNKPEYVVAQRIGSPDDVSRNSE